MYRRMIAAILFFMILGAAMIIAIAFSVAEKDDNNDPVTEKEVLVIRHLLDLEMEELESDTAFIADSYQMDFSSQNSSMNGWEKEVTFLNLGIDCMIILAGNESRFFHSSYVDGETITSDYLRIHGKARDSGYIHLDGFTCMFCSVPIDTDHQLVFIKIFDEKLVRDLNPFPELGVELHNVVEGPVSEGILEIANKTEENIILEGCSHLKILDTFNETIAVLELSK
jgi:hypothetical protein